MDYHYTIISPGGNTTAILHSEIEDRFLRKKIGNSIMSIHKEVEQVGFLSTNKKIPILTMAGGEFCGNATRAASYIILGGKPGEVLMKVSGMNSLVTAGIMDSGEAYVTIPTDECALIELQNGDMLVRMQGIAHVIVDETINNNAPEERTEMEYKNKALNILKQYQLNDEPAIGVMFVSPLSNYSCSIVPIVYVRDAGTFFYETACGSGTMATYLSFTKKNLKMKSIVQPSGAEFHVDQNTYGVRIAGPIFPGLVHSAITL
ncbi:MAG: hypothetical protein WCJ84_03355 [Candidatus Peregrinibacteria bacterium]